MSNKAPCNKSHLHLETILHEQCWNGQNLETSCFSGRLFLFCFFSFFKTCFVLSFFF